MIPKRAGSAPSPLADSPTLPPIPDTPAPVADNNGYGLQELAQPAVQDTSANAILTALNKFTKASKINIVPKPLFDNLVNKGLIVTYGEYAVISGKGLIYLVDFSVLT